MTSSGAARGQQGVFGAPRTEILAVQSKVRLMNRNDLPSRRNPKSAARLKRRDFLKSASAVAAAAALPVPAVWSPAKAQSRQETLLVVCE